MTDFNDDSYNNSGDSLEDFETTTLPGARPPKTRSSNRNFWIILGVLGGVFILALVVLVLLGLWILPQRSAARLEEAAQINAQNTATLVAATQNALLAAQAALSTNTPPPPAPQQITPTPVIVFASSTPTPEEVEKSAEAEIQEEEGVGGPLEDAGRTATLAYLLTQAATTQPDSLTQTAAAAATRTASALPETGFADQVGLPGMLGLAAILIVLVFLARKLRVSQV